MAALNASKDPQAVAIRQEIADGPSDLAHEKADCLAHGIPIAFPVNTVPSDQDARPLYLHWDALRRKQKAEFPPYANPLAPHFAYTPEQLDRIQKIIDSHPAVFALLHNAAKKPYLTNPPLNYSVFSKCREGAREILTESFLLAHRGDYSDAIAIQTLGFALARQFSRQPNLMNYLVGSAVQGIAITGLQDTLSMAGPNRRVDEQVASTLKANQIQFSLKDALAGETPTQLYVISIAKASSTKDPEGAFAYLAGKLGSARKSSVPATPEEVKFIGNTSDAATARYLRQQIVVVRAAGQTPSARDAAFKRIDAENAQSSNVDSAKIDPISAWCIPLDSYVSFGQNNRRMLARVQIILAASAVLSKRAQSGHYPAKLPGTFLDPYNGNQLTYRHTGDKSFIIYSVGPDGSYKGEEPAKGGATRFHYPPLPPVPIPADMLR